MQYPARVVGPQYRQLTPVFLAFKLLSLFVPLLLCYETPDRKRERKFHLTKSTDRE